MARSKLGLVVWGGLNGLYQIVGAATQKLRQKGKRVLEIREGGFSDRLLRTLLTFALIDFSWLFFRADSFMTAMRVGKQMLLHPNINGFLSGGIFRCGMDGADFLILLMSIALLMAADFLKYRGVVVRQALLRQDLWFRWLVYVGGVLAVLIFGIWGSAYDASSFIYFQF